MQASFSLNVKGDQRDYDNFRNVQVRQISAGETVIKVISVVATAFFLFAAFQIGDPSAILILVPVTIIVGALVWKYADTIASCLYHAGRESDSRLDYSHRTVVIPTNHREGRSYSSTRHTTQSSTSGSRHVGVGGGHSSNTRTTQSSTPGSCHVGVGGGHNSNTRTTESSGSSWGGFGSSQASNSPSSRVGSSSIGVGGGHNPASTTQSSSTGSARVAIGGSRNSRRPN